MQNKNTVKAATPTSPESASAFVNERYVLANIPVSRRTLADWRSAGKIPFVKINRRVLYHWVSVEDALLRQQKDAIK
jgi:hypothetical protein